MNKVTLAVTQMACSDDINANFEKAEHMVSMAAEQGAQIVLLQELFTTQYFCKDQNPKFFDLAHEVAGHPVLERMSSLAKKLSVVLPVSFFEKANRAYFNSVMVIDADGERLGTYRKSHIPHDPGYWEKYYFNPGDTGFKVWETRYAKIGVGICWDQWFPECARAMVLKGADVLLYPTAIGSRPNDLSYDSSGGWQRVMQGHAVANYVPVCASNRVGTEEGEGCTLNFYGTSFIAGKTGEILVQADRSEETVLTASIDLEEKSNALRYYGRFRDRRPSLYKSLLTLDGCTKPENTKKDQICF